LIRFFPRNPVKGEIPCPRKKSIEGWGVGKGRGSGRERASYLAYPTFAGIQKEEKALLAPEPDLFLEAERGTTERGFEFSVKKGSAGKVQDIDRPFCGEGDDPIAKSAEPSHLGIEDA
jgi:hypothetical protein